MSEVKRYRAPVLHHDTGWMKSYGWQVVMASDYDAAQSQLAALREELAKQRNHFREQLRGAKDVDKRLAAAEQRNAALLELLRDIYNQNELSGFDEQRILEAIKPTESGASE